MKYFTKLFIVAAFMGLATCQSTDDCPATIPRDTYLKIFGGFCFQFLVSQKRTHTQARQDCQSRGGTLALVKTQEIQTFLYTALSNDFHESYDKIWIGLNDVDKENEFKWEDGAPLTYSNWHEFSGPNSTSYSHALNHNENDCVVIDTENDGKWAEYPCEQQSFLLFFHEAELHPYICQYVASASTAVTGGAGTTVTVMANPCPAFSCDLDCGMSGFQKDQSGCSVCKCAV
uniref:C-type lectin domain-containing protein n=1 Tax=Biomphalaria glabrata TaxID=6526 RepID=A0A2C9JX41_BIOGL